MGSGFLIIHSMGLHGCLMIWVGFLCWIIDSVQNSPKGVIAPLALSYTNSSFVSSSFRPAVSGRNSNVHKRPKNVKAEKNQKVPFG